MVALRQLPGAVQSAFRALWGLDLAFADIVSTSSDPNLGAIRMAWWRERLEELDSGKSPPAEPRLQAVAGDLLPKGVSGEELSKLENAWLPLLDPFPWGRLQQDALKLRGNILFATGARLLGEKGAGAEAAGAIWSLIDGAHHCSDPTSQKLLIEEARSLLQRSKSGLPRKVRPLTVLAALLAADLVSCNSRISRLIAAIRHLALGKLPKAGPNRDP